MSQGVIRTTLADGLAWIEVHRPERLNALDRSALHELRDTLLAVGDDPAARVLLLSGAGERAFIAGADIGELDAFDAEEALAFIELGKEVTRLLDHARQPVIAVVGGYALGGGCEIALACDLIVASDTAQFGLPEVELGILPGWGGTQRLTRRIGLGRASEMVLTGCRVPASTALAWGLCDRVFPGERLTEEAATLGRAIAAKDAGALAAARSALRLRDQVSFADAMERETALFLDLFNRPERRAATQRFLRRG